MKKLLLVGLTLMLVGCGTSSSQKSNNSSTADTNNKQNVKVTEKQTATTVKLTVGKKTYKASLNKNKAAQSFLSLMPMELNLANNSYSYYCMMDNSLNASDSQIKTVKKGDIILQNGNTVYFVNKTYNLNKKATRLGTVSDDQFFAAIKSDAVVTIKK